MKLLLVALNAKFIHSSLALRCLYGYAKQFKEYISICEYTINHQEDFILQDIYVKRPDVVCFSCYIWNISMIRNIVKNLKKVLPKVKIVLGGAEVSYDAINILKENKDVDIIIRGEGEKTFYELVKHFHDGKYPIHEIDGITYKYKGEITQTGDRAPLALDDIPFVYDDMSGFNHRIIYYETQRGCPYNCQYCLSSIEKGVRFLSIERVKKELKFFLDNNVNQVKFVDRTFNSSSTHAKQIWRYLIENDNGVTNFHMEITADILDDESIDLLKLARVGLFQFEVGVQSTNLQTIEAIKRNTNFEKLKQVVEKLKSRKNIHLHLDLIIGLPFEGYESFSNSFNDVYLLQPEQFQLGFLKLLKGSGLREDADKYGIVYHDQAVYEVLYTKELSYDEVLLLKSVEEMVETYYNSGKARYALAFAIRHFKSPFDFYESLGKYWKDSDYHKLAHNKIELYDIFYDFIKQSFALQEYQDVFRDLLKFDLFINEYVKTLPSWLIVDEEQYKKRRWDLYNDTKRVLTYAPNLLGYMPKQLSKICYLGFFNYNIFDWIHNTEIQIEKCECEILFYYGEKNNVQFYHILP